MQNYVVRACLAAAAVLVVAACGDDAMAPPDVTFGETTLVITVNPTVNDDNAVNVPAPGAARAGITVAVDGSASALTNANGLAVLSPVAPGNMTLSLTTGGSTEQVAVAVTDKDLRELAVALDANGAAVMAEVRYAFGGQVVEITSATPIDQVNQALAGSNVIVFFRSGIYTGDLVFSGSSVTLFGEGEQGGQVTLNGNVTVSGSRNRIRGAVVTGDLSVPGSDAGLSFTRVLGSFTLDGSSATVLNSAFCGQATVTGSQPTLIGNAGLSPIDASEGGC